MGQVPSKGGTRIANLQLKERGKGKYKQESSEPSSQCSTKGDDEESSKASTQRGSSYQYRG